MFVTGQNGVIKLKLVSSVDKSIKPPPALLGFFLEGWLQGEGLLGRCPMAVWVWGFLLSLRELFGWKAAAKGVDESTEGGRSGSRRHLSSAPRWGGRACQSSRLFTCLPGILWEPAGALPGPGAIHVPLAAQPVQNAP